MSSKPQWVVDQHPVAPGRPAVPFGRAGRSVWGAWFGFRFGPGFGSRFAPLFEVGLRELFERGESIIRAGLDRPGVCSAGWIVGVWGRMGRSLVAKRAQ